jgi:hypothetical protein
VLSGEEKAEKLLVIPGYFLFRWLCLIGWKIFHFYMCAYFIIFPMLSKSYNNFLQTTIL